MAERMISKATTEQEPFLESYESKEHATTLLSMIKSSWEKRELCDIVLIAGNDRREIPAHRVVLLASSPYFANLFKREVNSRGLVVDNIFGDNLEILIKYCYTGHLDLRSDNVETILTAARQLQMLDVAETCDEFITKLLRPENCLHIARFAKSNQRDALAKKAEDMANQNFNQIRTTSEFFALDVELLSQLLSSDDLNVSSEEEVFFALMSWVQRDTTNRSPHVPQLLSQVRLALLSPNFLTENVEPICKSSECQQMILNAMKYHLLPDKRKPVLMRKSQNIPLADQEFSKRIVGTTLLAVGGTESKQSKEISTEIFNPDTNTWHEWKCLSPWRREFGTAIIKNNLILVGGRAEDFAAVNTVVQYNLVTFQARLLDPLILSRWGMGVAIMGGFLYAVGGYGDRNYLRSVERYNLQTQKWAMVNCMSIQRCGLGVVALDGLIYAIGGFDGVVYHQSVECYDPQNDTWAMRAPMLEKRSHLGIAAANGYIYVIGGYDGVSDIATVERYNPRLDKWQKMASMRRGRCGIGCIFFGNRLWAIGGLDSHSRFLTTVEEYSVDSDQWTTKKSLKYGREVVCVIEVPYQADADSSMKQNEKT